MAKKPTHSKQASTFYHCIGWIKAHKVLASFALGILVLCGTWVGYAYNQYQQKFSEEDFAILSSTAETVLDEVSSQKIENHRSCSYQRPGEFASMRLYCTIQLATFVPYNSDSFAIMIARALEQAISQRYQTVIGTTQSFIREPGAGYSDITVTSDQGSTRRQCNFQIGSGIHAQSLVPFLPRKLETNLIGLYFECSAESRGEYFPVTYRQG